MSLATIQLRSAGQKTLGDCGSNHPGTGCQPMERAAYVSIREENGPARTFLDESKPPTTDASHRAALSLSEHPARAGVSLMA